MFARTARSLSFLFVAASLACASSNSAPAAGSTATRGSRSPDLITAQEINTTPAGNAYDVIQRLRPQWMRTSGVSSVAGGAARQGAVVAFVDNVRLNRFDELRSVSASGITSIRYYNAERAASLPNVGSGLVAGAVVVSTKTN